MPASSSIPTRRPLRRPDTNDDVAVLIDTRVAARRHHDRRIVFLDQQRARPSRVGDFEPPTFEGALGVGTTGAGRAVTLFRRSARLPHNDALRVCTLQGEHLCASSNRSSRARLSPPCFRPPWSRKSSRPICSSLPRSNSQSRSARSRYAPRSVAAWRSPPSSSRSSIRTPAFSKASCNFRCSTVRASSAWRWTSTAGCAKRYLWKRRAARRYSRMSRVRRSIRRSFP